MATISNKYLQQMLKSFKDYKTAELWSNGSKISAANVSSLTWKNPNSNYIETNDDIMITDIPQGSTVDTLKIKTQFRISPQSRSTGEPVNEYHQLLGTNLSQNGIYNIGEHKISSTVYPFVLYPISGDLTGVVNKLNITGGGDASDITNAYDMVKNATTANGMPFDGFNNPTNSHSVFVFDLEGPGGSRGVYLGKHANYLIQNADGVNANSGFAPTYKATLDSDERTVSYDLDIHKNENLVFDTKGTIVTRIKQSLVGV